MLYLFFLNCLDSLGGRQIRTIIEDFALTNMDIADSGSVQISAFDQGNLTKAESFVKSLVSGAAAPSRGGASGGGGPEGGRVRPGAYSGPEPVIGEVYEGKITGVQNFGIFVEILPGPEDGSTRGFEALCHISELSIERVTTCEAFVSSLGAETLKVKYLGKDDRGKTKVSRKAVLQAGQPVPPRRPPLMDRTNNNANGENVPPPAQMSDAELDVIAKAIEGL
jgi:polyribonucleotide nucleotidyltransferase